MKYPGGKGKCYQRLINLMPPHQTYIESHLGGGAVMRNKKAAQRNIGLEIDPVVIEQWRAEQLGLCELHQVDAVTFLESFPFTGNELVYVDPPYVPETRRRAKVYRCDYTYADHQRLLDCLVSLPCKVMLSGYDNELYNSVLCGWRKVQFSAKTHTGVRKEVVWMNFDTPDRLHDCRYRGETFRERQNIQRRQARLRSRIDDMDAMERSELLQWMQENYGNAGEAA
ncbi:MULTISPECIES: DNA adenine methylase [Pseudomonas]|uniref:DNA adenine methylase n=1 Tax=Pseudomonas putida TaxID=303 RepID=A0AAW6PSR5_PSEPU|nr:MULTISPECIES: DNA adenine methylase [Pseudomonas]MBH3469072.1 DNA adenine methylase [Pseudomonas putida]MCE0778721.1 DNA adenine methylase [Pseudomonas sp. NMI542_15]MCE1021560.1 DNA adenine methylase [Pseudomonas monteilii]MCE1038850.1 DNA adenine methylase [Pseudomonas monteilii]MCE1090761.1 DNA adenine methylase [Pseudomonas monteilii]